MPPTLVGAAREIVSNLEGFYGHLGQTFDFQYFVTHKPKAKNAYVTGVNDATVPAEFVYKYGRN